MAAAMAFRVRAKPTMRFPPAMPCMHVGAIASAVSWISPNYAPLARSLGGLVVATRIVLLAHDPPPLKWSDLNYVF